MIGFVATGWLVEALIASTVLMVVVLLLRRPVHKAFGANVAYALWLLPVLRLVLPPLPAEWHDAAVAPVLGAAGQMAGRMASHMAGLLAEPASDAAPAAVAYPWLVPALALLWVAGAGAFLAWHSLVHHRFCQRLLDQAVSSEARDGVQVIETEAATGPLAFGIWRRYVAFPRDFAERFDLEERDLALAHEVGHHARGDLVANWVALVVLALHWFNPIAWRAFRAFRADQEIANDARVLAGMNPMRRHTYACAILKAAHPTFLGAAVSATCHLHTIDDLKGRLRMLTTNKTSRVRLLGGGATVAVLLLGGLGFTASGSQAAERVRSGVKDATGVDIAALVPAPPPGPAFSEAMPDIADVPDPGETAVRVPPEPAAPARPPRGADGSTGTYAVTITKDGKRIIQHGHHVQLNRDGSYTMVGSPPAPVSRMPSMEAMPSMDRMPAAPPAPPRSAAPPRPPIPQVISRACGRDGDPRSMVLRSATDGGVRIVVCTDRIAIAAARGAVLAANRADIQRTAYTHALGGLRDARERMVSADMAGEQRRAALQGIDTAIAELEQDLAKAR